MASKDMQFSSPSDLLNHVMVCIKEYAKYHEFKWPEGASRCTSDHEQNMHLIMTYMPNIVAEIMLSISDHNDHCMNKGFTKMRVKEFSRILEEMCDEYYDEQIKLQDQKDIKDNGK